MLDEAFTSWRNLRNLSVAFSTVAVAVTLVVATAWSGPSEASDRASVTCSPVPATEPATEPLLSSYEPRVPVRVVDTRVGTGGVGVALGARCTLMLDTTGLGTAETEAFALSVTAISSVRGFFTAFPCAAGRPTTSNVNAREGFPTPNLVVAAPDSANRVCLYSDQGGHVVVDVSGAWGSGLSRFTPIEPARALDTRALTPPTRLSAGAVKAVDVGGVVVPDDATAVTVNLAAVRPTTNGWIVVYPCGVAPPLASNLNVRAGERRAVSAIVQLGDELTDPAAEGKLCVTGNVETDVLIDVTGYYAPVPETNPSLALAAVSDERLVDTRIGVGGTRLAAGVVQRFSLEDVLDRPDEAVAAMVNVVAVRADRASFLNVYPCTSGPPTTSSLNYDLNQTANLVVTALTDDIEFCVVANSSVDVVIDVVAAFTGPQSSLITELSLRTAAGDSVALDQSFDPEGENSTVHCPGGVLDLRLGLAPRATATVNGTPFVPGPDVDPGTSIMMASEDLLTISVARGGSSQVHYIRCVPTDFPRLTVTSATTPASGWYLTELGWVNPSSGRFLAILDERGVPVWFKRTGSTMRVINFQLLPSGDLAATPVTGIGFGKPTAPPIGHRIYDLTGQLVGEHSTDDPVAFPVDHHDVVEIPASAGGGFATISYPLRTGIDLDGPVAEDTLTLPPSQGRANDCPAAFVNDSSAIVDGAIREVDSSGALRWEWLMSDAFDWRESTYTQCFAGNYPDDEMDVFHINALQRVDGASGDYIVTARHADAVFRIDRTTKDVEWIVGGVPGMPNKSGAPRLQIVGDPLGGPLRMHDGRLHGDVLTMYDNRTDTAQPSRAVAYRIDTSDPDEANWTATMLWQVTHPANLTSPQIGSARVTPDGSVLVGWGATQPMFVEYSSPATGLQELLRISVSPNDSAYRIVKYGPEAFDADELRATAGGTLEQP